MNFSQIHSVYFIGIGGIGMSALARYFKAMGKTVSGYDKTPTTLTKQLQSEGIEIHFEDWGDKVLSQIDSTNSLIIYTPAVPKNHGELTAFLAGGYTVIKRAKALGIISSEFETFAVAGTHGKTTTSTLLAHVLHHTKEGCNAFIGGISSNYNSNCIINASSKRVVVEADEFDRSFLHLKPNYSIVTSMDADHLDIYGDGDHLKKSFLEYIHLTNPTGMVAIHASIELSEKELPDDLKTIRYAIDQTADWKGQNTRYDQGKYWMDIVYHQVKFENVELGLPGFHNAENALAVFAICFEIGIEEEIIRKALASYKGVKRRFDFQIRNENLIVIDDYAHHPTEIKAFLGAVRQLYPTKKITTVFQPHLFSRTRDFMDGFADSLSLSDELLLLPIYPAREEPIPGITSEKLLAKVALAAKQMSSKKEVVADLSKSKREVVLIVGAGDIDTCVEPIKNHYLNEV